MSLLLKKSFVHNLTKLFKGREIISRKILIVAQTAPFAGASSAIAIIVSQVLLTVYASMELKLNGNEWKCFFYIKQSMKV